MSNGHVPINEAPSNSVVKVVKLGSERLNNLGIMENSIIKVVVSIPHGPVLVQRDDAFIVLDTEAASNTLVSVLSTQQQGKHRYRWRRGRFHN
ncbi:FeoA domain-containing protein [Caldivirga sp.]|uniref:FeoA domain-containing protein n=1 Tax=Caldivirga sp. TaxID=2080243 RepID=UPI003D121CAE